MKNALRTGIQTADLQQAILDHLHYSIGHLEAFASPHDYYRALSLAIRDRLLHRWINTSKTYFDVKQKVVCYLSAEYLLGPHLGNNLVNLNLEQAARDALAVLGQNFDDILACEEEPGLGNGGLGRLAACFLDSLATLQYPAIGYGIRYEFGIFDQEIHDGWQSEITDKWLRYGNPWEIAKPDVFYYVNWGGYTEQYYDESGNFRVRWLPTRVVKGTVYDTPIQGYGVNTCNTLRLWNAEAVESFDFQTFNIGDYYQAVNEKLVSETVTKVLYPNDEPEIGKRLRLEQQYFFVSCSLQDMLHLLDMGNAPVESFAQHFVVQLNDTHPSIGVVELMRLLVDVRLLDWDTAWSITVATFGYTNHTLLPEALETWPVSMFHKFLPRHLELIYEINRRFLNEVRATFPGDEARVARMSIIGEENGKTVRMAHLAAVGSHAINGVAALHSNLLKANILRDFYQMWPQRFNNITNGVTPRRFLALANPGLRSLLNQTIGDRWLMDLNELKKLEPYIDDAAFRHKWSEVKQTNKRHLADFIYANTKIELDSSWLFDVQVKRIHEYKRQHLNLLHIITLYHRLKNNPTMDFVPRAFIFAGKAAPGYFMAKRIIKLINDVAETINADPDVNTRIKVAFVPNFNVQNAQLIYAAADLSEQISTAGKEASGTGNMKFMLNGAVTIGTLDGANIEIREEAGPDNFFKFGLTADEVESTIRQGYRPMEYIAKNEELGVVLDLIAGGRFSHGDIDIFQPVVENLRHSDPYLVLADYADYIDCQRKVSEAWNTKEHWLRMSILNSARSAKFSSDRAIGEYCKEIWDLQPVLVS